MKPGHAGTANGAPDGQRRRRGSRGRTPRGSRRRRARAPACRAPRAGRPRSSHIAPPWRSARSRSWVTTIAAAPASHCARSIAKIARAWAGSSPAVGSSSSRHRAPWHSACATITRRASPPDSSSNRRRREVRRHRRRPSRRAGRGEIGGAREPEPALVRVAAEQHDLLDRERERELVVLRQVRELAARSRGAARAADRGRARGSPRCAARPGRRSRAAAWSCRRRSGRRSRRARRARPRRVTPRTHVALAERDGDVGELEPRHARAV